MEYVIAACGSHSCMCCRTVVWPPSMPTTSMPTIEHLQRLMATAKSSQNASPLMGDKPGDRRFTRRHSLAAHALACQGLHEWQMVNIYSSLKSAGPIIA